MNKRLLSNVQVTGVLGGGLAPLTLFKDVAAKAAPQGSLFCLNVLPCLANAPAN
jgi:hypothetical protein